MMRWSPATWEAELGALVVGRAPSPGIGAELAEDAGVTLLQKLSLEFRASMIASNLRRTTRLLMLALGEDVFRMILSEYRSRVTPQLFAATEARAFARFISELGVGVPQLAEVVEFELAVLDTLVDGRTRLVRFDFDPLPMLLALERRQAARRAGPGRGVRDRDHCRDGEGDWRRPSADTSSRRRRTARPASKHRAR